MKRTFFKGALLLCTALALTTSCNNENSPTSEYESTAFRITSIVNPLTRAPQLDENGAGKFTDGDQNSLFFFTDNQNPVSTFLYTYGQSYFWSDLNLPQNTSTFTITGCYPPANGQENDILLWSTQTNNAQDDLLLATPQQVQNKTTTAIPLVFSHALHKISVELIVDKTSITDEMESDARIGCRNLLPIAYIDLKKGKVTNAIGNKCAFSLDGKKAHFIVAPQPVADIEISIHINKKDFAFKLADKAIGDIPLKQLHAGQQLVFQIAVNNESFSIISQEISGWESQGEVSDSILF